MNAGRKTLLALAISSVMAGSTNVMAQDYTPKDPLLDASGKQEILATEKILGDTYAIKVTNGNATGAVTNNGWIEAQNGAAILVEEGGNIGYINNSGTIIGGIVTHADGTKERVAIDIRGASVHHLDALKVGESIKGEPNKGGTVKGNIYLNSEHLSNYTPDKEVDDGNGGKVIIDEVMNSSYISFYGNSSDKAIFDGTKIAGAGRVFVESNSYLLLKAQDETIKFELVDYYFDNGVDKENSTISNGHLTLKNDSTLEMEINGQLSADQAYLDVDGDVIFSSGAKLQITTIGDVNDMVGSHKIIEADSVQGYDEKNVNVSGGWITKVELIEGDDNTANIKITLDEKVTSETLIRNASAGGADATEQAVIKAFGDYALDGSEVTEDEITYADTVANADVKQELINLLNAAGDPDSAARLSGELTPDRSGAALHAAQRAQNKQFDTISNRLNSLRADQFHAVNASNSGLWMRVYGNDAKQNVDGRIDGYDVQGMGFSFGIDGDLTENLVTGFSFSQNYQDIDTITYDTNYEVNTYQFSAYSLWNHDQYFATAAVNAGVDYYDSYRTIGATTGYTGETRANAEYKAFHYGARVTAGMDLAFDNILVQPIIAGELNRVEIEDYCETGSPASIDYGKQTVNQVKLGMGTHISSTFEIASGILTPSLTAMGWYDFKAGNENITGAIAADPSVIGEITTATGSTEVQLNLAAGIDYTIDGGLSLGLGLQHDFVDDGHDTQLQARMNYAF
ncbi:autotransporter outer membrane beta-barrel domain-containing protein [Endozoicomonas sp.]|uniref:autotransporter family protein n=1 Tax=Endozoicomonas sp. TaxID=1892382 RepID=UPI003AF7B8E0